MRQFGVVLARVVCRAAIGDSFPVIGFLEPVSFSESRAHHDPIGIPAQFCQKVFWADDFRFVGHVMLARAETKGGKRQRQEGEQVSRWHPFPFWASHDVPNRQESEPYRHSDNDAVAYLWIAHFGFSASCDC